MNYAIIPAFIALVCTANISGDEVAKETTGQNNEPAPIVVAELDKQLDGKEVTIKFAVAAVDGIAQRHVPGQAPSFVITAKSHGTRRLSVWIVGELANVLDRLQMSYLQDHQPDVGTMIQATGKLRVHTMDSELFSSKSTNGRSSKFCLRGKTSAQQNDALELPAVPNFKSTSLVKFSRDKFGSYQALTNIEKLPSATTASVGWATCPSRDARLANQRTSRLRIDSVASSAESHATRRADCPSYDSAREYSRIAITRFA